MILGFSKWQTKSTTYLYFIYKIWRVDCIFNFINGLEPLKPLVIKLQKRNSDICKGYQMIDKVITDIRHLRENIDHSFDHWYEFEW